MAENKTIKTLGGSVLTPIDNSNLYKAFKKQSSIR